MTDAQLDAYLLSKARVQGHKAQVAPLRLTSSQAATRSCTRASCAPTLSSSPSISSMVAVPYLHVGRGGGGTATG